MKLWQQNFGVIFPRATTVTKKITHQKFRFFTFSREEALALDRICCSDNLDMLYFNYCDRFTLLVLTHILEQLSAIFRGHRNIRWPEFIMFGRASNILPNISEVFRIARKYVRISSEYLREPRRMPNIPERQGRKRRESLGSRLNFFVFSGRLFVTWPVFSFVLFWVFFCKMNTFKATGTQNVVAVTNALFSKCFDKERSWRNRFNRQKNTSYLYNIAWRIKWRTPVGCDFCQTVTLWAVYWIMAVPRQKWTA